MPVDHTEKGFEQAIEHSLLTGGYRKGTPADFHAALAIDRPTLIEFLKDSQPDEWSKLASIYGKDVETKVVENIAANLDQRGMLECLRHGVSDRGVKMRLAFFQPATGMNPETLALYKKNILTITRQVHFSEKAPTLSIDAILGLNGLPVATATRSTSLNTSRVWSRRSTRTRRSWLRQSAAGVASSSRRSRSSPSSWTRSRSCRNATTP